MTNIMKEISPFMHTALFNYSQFKTFDELEQSGMFKYCLNSEFAEELLKKSTCIVPVSEIIEDNKLQEVSLPIIAEQVPITATVSSRPIIVKEQSNQYQNTRYNSRKPDTLFWSIFIAHYGVREFTEIGSKYMNREIEEKMRVMEFIKNNRPRMKSMKITAATGEEMMGDLLTNQSTSMLVLPALALFYETRLWIVSEETNTYLEYLPSTDTEYNISNIMIIYRTTQGNRVSYTTETMVSDQRSQQQTTESTEGAHIRNLIEKIQQTMIRIENVEHPFKGISTYKLVDLEEIARKCNVQIPAGEKWKKNDWYVAISRHAQLGWIEPTRGRKPKDH